MEVGIRELRADLSRWLRRVQEGEEVVVTDRGKPVARLEATGAERALDRLVREGIVERAPAPSAWLPTELIPVAQPVSELVSEQRR